MTELPFIYTGQDRPDFDPSELGPGTIIVPVRDDLARYNQFAFSLAALIKPEDTRLVYTTGLNVVQSLNDTFKHDFYGDWCLLLGDDHVMPPWLIAQLARHDEDIVGAVNFTRRAPFHWTLFKAPDDNGHGWLLYDDDELPSTGLASVGALGSAGLFIRRNVIEAFIEDRGYVFTNTSARAINEDLEFCAHARELGFTVFCDMAVRLGHLGTMSTAAHYDEEQGWGVAIEFPGGFGRIFIPGVDHRKTFARAAEEAAA